VSTTLPDNSRKDQGWRGFIRQLLCDNARHHPTPAVNIYHVASGTAVVAILRPARTPKGTEVRTVVKHATKRLKRHWPNTRAVWRGDSSLVRLVWAFLSQRIGALVKAAADRPLEPA
jgi:hypothetical protein